MDNSNITKAGLFQNNDTFVQSSDDGYGTIVLYIIVFIVVAILVAHYAGYNVFNYLGKFTDSIGDNVLPIWQGFLEKIGYSTGDSVKQAVNVSAKGTKSAAQGVSQGSEKVEEVTASTSKDTASTNKKASGKSPVDNSASVDETTTEDVEEEKSGNEVVTKVTKDETITTKNVQKNIKQAMESSQPTQAELRVVEEQKYKPTDMFSESTHPKPSSNKAGWCYIGNYSGYRSCSRVGDADKCMSGDIFPTQDVCVNPSLRA